MDKGERELMVFREFASCVGIPGECITGRNPPEPDILCMLRGKPVYFELTLGTDEHVEEQMARYDNSGETGGTGCAVDVFGGVCSILKSKFSKTYVTIAAHEIHLLVYLEITTERFLMERLEREAWLAKSLQDGPFSMIWFYDRNYPTSPVGRIEREPMRMWKHDPYARYDFRGVSMMRSSKAN
jgi:hypothetical protein